MTSTPQRPRDRIRAILARLLLLLFAIMPLWLSHAIGYLIGIIGNIVHNEMRYAARINIKLCMPQLSTVQQLMLCRQYLIETGKTFTETSAMLLWPRWLILRQMKTVIGEELVRQAQAEGKGVIFAIPHLGSWEMVGLYCSSRYPMTSLYRPARLQAMDSIIRRGRERFGASLVPTDNRGVKALLKALSNGETVAILPDQVPAQGQGLYAPFFGHSAYSASLLSRLAQKTGAVVLFTYAERLSWGRGYRIHFLPAPEAINVENLQQSVIAVNKGVEMCVRECPQQYQWGYRRFKSQPPGQAEFY
ncbi:MAG: lysophospholipid acyltransferase family protein [Gammaproteobacteria bacterium]|nr:lysophospholipid acyltransferase family protein [Gammaproteobacteria bacterium]